jgi:hypothetical protein
MFKHIKNPDGSITSSWDADPKIALQQVMDYHEEEGCKAYLELYPAPEKGEWAWIAQDSSGHWFGFDIKPDINQSAAIWGNPVTKLRNLLIISPPNPFWRKTLR